MSLILEVSHSSLVRVSSVVHGVDLKGTPYAKMILLKAKTAEP